MGVAFCSFSLWVTQADGLDLKEHLEGRLLPTHRHKDSQNSQESPPLKEGRSGGHREAYSLANVILVCKLLIVEAKLVNKIGYKPCCQYSQSIHYVICQP